MKEKIEDIIRDLKNQLETVIPFNKSEISILNKPTIMGNGGLCYDFETSDLGLVIFYWNSGAFEITTDLFSRKNEDVFFRSFVPLNHQTKYYPDESLMAFIEVINDVKKMLQSKYPDPSQGDS